MAKMTVMVMGDVCMEKKQDLMDEAYAKSYLAECLPLLFRADVRIANLENAICAPEHPIAKCGPNLWQRPENMVFFKEAGVDCCILANNHTGDFGPDGLVNTLRELDAQGFGRVGAGMDLDDAYKPWYTDTPAGRLAVCAFCENEFGGATLDLPGSAGFDLHRVSCAIREARAHADFVLVVMHGGNEHNPISSPNVVARYRTFVDFGADAVVGMHPHCPQGFETYRGAPIVYSLGNFFFRWYANDPGGFRGYIVELTFEKKKPAALTVHPYRYNDDTTKLHLFGGAERETMLAYLDRLSAYIKDERELRRMFDGWCTITGPSHAAYAYKEEYLEQHDFPTGHPMLAVRNIRTCEAHNELVTNLSRMIIEGRVEEGRKTALEIKELQIMPV